MSRSSSIVGNIEEFDETVVLVITNQEAPGLRLRDNFRDRRNPASFQFFFQNNQLVGIRVQNYSILGNRNETFVFDETAYNLPSDLAKPIFIKDISGNIFTIDDILLENVIGLSIGDEEQSNFGFIVTNEDFFEPVLTEFVVTDPSDLRIEPLIIQVQATNLPDFAITQPEQILGFEASNFLGFGDDLNYGSKDEQLRGIKNISDGKPGSSIKEVSDNSTANDVTIGNAANNLEELGEVNLKPSSIDNDQFNKLSAVDKLNALSGFGLLNGISENLLG